MRNEDILYKLADRLVLDFDSNFKCLLGNNRASNFFFAKREEEIMCAFRIFSDFKRERGLKEGSCDVNLKI